MGAYFESVRLYILAIRTPLWEAICFTQTGQRSGELTANSDQVSAQERLGAEVCVSSYFAAAKDALSLFAEKHIASHSGCFWQCLSSV